SPVAFRTDPWAPSSQESAPRTPDGIRTRIVLLEREVTCPVSPPGLGCRPLRREPPASARVGRWLTTLPRARPPLSPFNGGALWAPATSLPRSVYSGAVRSERDLNPRSPP